MRALLAAFVLAHRLATTSSGGACGAAQHPCDGSAKEHARIKLGTRWYWQSGELMRGDVGKRGASLAPHSLDTPA